MVITTDSFDFAKYFTKHLGYHPEEIEKYFMAEKRYLIDNIDTGTKALEVGCGSGRIMNILADICEHVTGIDNSEYLLEKAKDLNIDNATLYLMDIEEVDKISEKYDIITLMDNTFGNIIGEDEQINLLRKLKELLNENGRIIISVYSDSEETKKVQEVSYETIGLRVKDKGEDTHTTYTEEGLVSKRFTEEELLFILKEANLVAEIEELTPISYICEAKIISAAQ